MATNLDSLQNDVFVVLSKYLNNRDLSSLRAVSRKLHQNHGLLSVFRSRYLTRPLFKYGSLQWMIYAGQLHCNLQSGDIYGDKLTHLIPQSSRNISDAEVQHLHAAEFFNGKKVLTIAGNVMNTLVLCEDGVYGYGWRCGDRDQSATRVDPIKLNFFEDIKVLSIAYRNGCAYLISDQGLFSCPDPLQQTAPPDYYQAPIRIPFFNDKKILDLYFGFEHVLVHCEQGLYGFGLNSSGQLGLGHTEHQIESPVEIEFFQNKKIKKILKYGQGATLVFCEDGIYAFGPQRRPNTLFMFHDHYDEYPTPEKISTFLGKDIIDVIWEFNSIIVLCSDGTYQSKISSGYPTNCLQPSNWLGPEHLQNKSLDIQSIQDSKCLKLCISLLNTYLNRPRMTVYHRKRAQDLIFALRAVDGQPKKFIEVLDHQLALYEKTHAPRKSSAYDHKFFSTGLHHKTKGPKWGYYATLLKCRESLGYDEVNEPKPARSYQSL